MRRSPETSTRRVRCCLKPRRKTSPVASNSLTGTQVWAPVLASRFTGVHRVWLVQWAGQLSARPNTKIGREELVLVHGMHLVRRWTVQSVVLTLYAT